MVHLENKTAAQSVTIPYELAATGTPDALVLRSSVNLRETVCEVEEPVASANGRYWTVTVSLPAKLPDGSYEYELRSGSSVLSAGCARIGDYAAEDKQYEKTIEYNQYVEN